MTSKRLWNAGVRWSLLSCLGGSAGDKATPLRSSECEVCGADLVIAWIARDDACCLGDHHRLRTKQRQKVLSWASCVSLILGRCTAEAARVVIKPAELKVREKRREGLEEMEWSGNVRKSKVFFRFVPFKLWTSGFLNGNQFVSLKTFYLLLDFDLKKNASSRVFEKSYCHDKVEQECSHTERIVTTCTLAWNLHLATF